MNLWIEFHVKRVVIIVSCFGWEVLLFPTSGQVKEHSCVKLSGFLVLLNSRRRTRRRGECRTTSLCGEEPPGELGWRSQIGDHSGRFT
jgi:hypothetical protein